MTSKKSSADTFRFTYLYTIKKNCWLPVLLFLYNLFYHLYTPIVEYFNKFVLKDFDLYPRELLYAFYDAGDDMFGVIFTAGVLIGPLVLGAMIYRYMMNKSAVNVYYSLGVTRTTMFWSKFAAGATMLTLALAIPLIISALLNVVFFGSSAELWQTFFYILVHYVTIELFILSVVALTFSLVGTVIEGLAFSTVYALSPFVVAIYIQHLFKTYLVGSPEASTRWASPTRNLSILGYGHFDYFNVDYLNVDDFLLFPFSSSLRLRSMLYVEKNYTLPSPDYSTIIFWIVLTVAVMLFGWLAFKKRRTEIAGFMGANPKATFFAVLVVSTFICSTIIPELIYVTTAKDKFILCAVSALVFGLIYIVVDIISLRSFKKIVKTLWKYPIHLAIYFVFVIIFATGFFGYKTRMPEIDKIESVSISTETGDIFISSLNVGYQDRYYVANDEDNYLPVLLSMREEDEHRLVGGFTDKADIERALDIHKKLIDISDAEVNEDSVSAPYGEKIRPVSIDIVYHLKNGKTLQRAYFVANDEIMKQLSEFTESAHYRELALNTLKNISPFDPLDYSGLSSDDLYKLETINSLYDDRFQIGFASPNLTTLTAYPEYNGAGTLKQDILEAVGKDIEAGTLPLNLKSDSRILGYILIKDFAYVVSDGNHSASYGENGEVYVTVDHDGVYVDKVEQETIEISKGTRFDDQIFSFILNDDRGIAIPVYENMANTVSYINENGYADALTDSMKPVSVKLWNGVGGGNDYLYQFRGTTMLFNGMVCDEYFPEYDLVVPKMPDTAQVITDDPETIADYEARSRLMYYNCNKGMYAQFVYADGSSTFAYIPE